MKKNLINSLFCCLVLGSCVRTPEQASRKIKNLLDRFPTAIDTVTKVTTEIDTVIKIVYIDRVIKDTAKTNDTYRDIDTILINGGCDTVIIEKIRYKCRAENLLPGVDIDTLGVKLKIRYKGNEQIINLEASNTEITKEVTIEKSGLLTFYEPPLTKNHWFWFFVAAAVCFLLSLYINITR